MYTGFDELSKKIDDILKIIKEIDDRGWKNRSAMVDICIMIGFEDNQISRLTGATKEDIDFARIFMQ